MGEDRRPKVAWTYRTMDKRNAKKDAGNRILMAV
jgi:hypothetical protein